MQLIPTEILDKDGSLQQIEFYDLAGNFIIQAVWDPQDEQTNENRSKFRQWAYRMIEQQNYEVIK